LGFGQHPGALSLMSLQGRAPSLSLWDWDSAMPREGSVSPSAGRCCGERLLPKAAPPSLLGRGRGDRITRSPPPVEVIPPLVRGGRRWGLRCLRLLGGGPIGEGMPHPSAERELRGIDLRRASPSPRPSSVLGRF